MRVGKRITKKSFHGAYKRRNGVSMFVRDRFGRCETYRLVGGVSGSTARES